MKKVTVTFTIPQKSKNNPPLIATIPLYFPYHENITSEDLYGNKKLLEKANEGYEVIQPGETLKLNFLKSSDGPVFGWALYKGKKLGTFGANYVYKTKSIENAIPPDGCDQSFYHAKLKRSFDNEVLLFSMSEISDMITAKTVTVTPVSQRRKGAKYSLMEVEFDIDPSLCAMSDNVKIEEVEDV